MLIVDDHAGFRGFARALLEADGFVVLGEAVDGRTAVESARALRPDVVLLDVALPDVDGFVVCERILADLDPPTTSAQAPVVVLTSTRHTSAFTSRLVTSKARGFIAKQDLSGAALAELVNREQLS